MNRSFWLTVLLLFVLCIGFGSLWIFGVFIYFTTKVLFEPDIIEMMRRLSWYDASKVLVFLVLWYAILLYPFTILPRMLRDGFRDWRVS